MASAKQQSIEEQQVEADLQKFEIGIRQLKIQYDQYFAGGRKRPPTLLRFDLNKMMKRYLDLPMPKYHHRFKFNALVARFNIMGELWDKKVRQGEEGRRPMPVRLSKQREQNRLVASYVVTDPTAEREDLKTLHEQFVAAREKQGLKNAEVPFAKFLQGVSGQTRRLQEQSGCGEIELRLIVHDGKVQLRARPGR